MTKLSDYIRLFRDKGILVSTDVDEIPEIEYISYNSQDIKANTLFFCKGAHFKPEYLFDAVKKGAVAYVSETRYETDIPCVLVSDIRETLPLSACFFYDNCYKKLNLVGITGTKGKSTTAYFIKYIVDEYLAEEGKGPSAILSSIDSYDGVIKEESHLTTPEPFELHKSFSNAVNSGIEYFTMEVSSQALKYGRVEGVDYDIGCYLNIGLDHISAIEHPDFEDYFMSKMKLFSQCKTAIVNLDSDKSDEVLKYAKNAKELITFSRKDKNADVYAYGIHKDGSDTVFNVKTKKMERTMILSIPGLFNVENALCAIAVAEKLNIAEEYIYVGLIKARSSGRMEVYENANKTVTTIVDYAHNRLSYETLFNSVKEEYPGRKIAIVFGCPGNKALVRRKDLGEVSGLNADISYITEEDPGEEPLEKISNEIAEHIKAVGGKYKIINDRGQAIRTAIEENGENSVILITGKGNETRQKRGLEYVECPTDVEYAIAALKQYDIENGLDSTDRIQHTSDITSLLQKVKDKRIVIKLGGSCLDDEQLMDDLLDEISLLEKAGAKILIVHGGGKEISRSLEQMGLHSDFYEGYRVTGDSEIDIVEKVLSGGVNKRIVSKLTRKGIRAVGISGVDAKTITAVPKLINGRSIGRVGEVESVNTKLIKALDRNEFTVVLSPVSYCKEYGAVNVNADDAASSVTSAVGADYLIFITDVKGLFLDKDNEKTVLEHITVEKARQILSTGLAKGGMIPKITNIINIIESGVKEVSILNGKVRYNILSQFMDAKTEGTIISKE